MAFENSTKSFSKRHVYIVEIDTEYCQLDFGVLPCTASGSGDAKCYNTRASCQDLDNIDESNKTYSFSTTNISDLSGVIPSIDSVSTAPAAIDIAGGIGTRSSVTITINDHPSSDLDVDKYVGERTYIASERGSFWTRFRARNPFYKFNNIRVKTGFLVDNKFDSSNFETHHYVIDKLDVSNGKCKIVAKDVLKLADNKKAQAPEKSTGALSADITSVATSATLTPVGVGSEYPSIGYIRISDEVMSFTRLGDVMTITRGQYNTAAKDHSEGDTAQICLEYIGDTVDEIIYDLLVNYAGVDPSFIDTTDWANEVGDNLPNGLNALITEPVGVQELLRELAASAPHSLYWEDVAQKIILQAVKTPTIEAEELNETQHLLPNFSVKDDDKKRINTVFVYYGQLDPTQKLDEVNNYRNSYVRLDAENAVAYGDNPTEKIFSRWIRFDNKDAVVNLAARLGRRFARSPRELNFELDVKDYNKRVGQSVNINHRDLTDFSGANVNTLFQIISQHENKTNYKVKALEYTYGGALPEDEGSEDPDQFNLTIESQITNYNIKESFDANYPNVTLDATKTIKVIVKSGSIIGSQSTSNPSLETGTGFNGATISLYLESGSYIVGKGGDGEGASTVANDGGDAININHPVTIENYGIIGGGGGAGGGVELTDNQEDFIISGSAGAGYLPSRSSFNTGVFISDVLAGDSTVEFSGSTSNGFVLFDGTDIESMIGGKGGDLGQDGNLGSTTKASMETLYDFGYAGDAIVTNSNAITWVNMGDVRGSIV